VPEAELLDVVVEFQEAAASSLNFLLLARFAGTQAPNYPALGRLLQRAAVDSCRRHGWSIPFPHLVVQQKA
jgi:small-conductance mechanosensitive channel